MTSTLPPAAEKANANTLSEALAATSLSTPASPSSDAKELNGDGDDDKSGELEDGEIREDEEEDDGRVKTVFDDADKFNVKVGSGRSEMGFADEPAPIVFQLDIIL